MKKSQPLETKKHRFNYLKKRYHNAVVFYHSNTSQEKKDNALPSFHEVVDELGDLFVELKAAGVVTDKDLPQITAEQAEEQARLIFKGRDMG